MNELEQPVATNEPIQPAKTPQVAPRPKPKVPPALIAAVAVILIGSLLLLLATKFQTSKQPAVPTPTPTLIPTPTPERIPSALATQSAFLKLELAVATLSASIKNYVVDDPSLSPPILDLPLGFQ